jgi:hypothetical protein
VYSGAWLSVIGTAFYVHGDADREESPTKISLKLRYRIVGILLKTIELGI